MFMEKENYCSQCGSKLNSDESYCPHCGAKVNSLPTSDYRNASGKKQTPKFRWKWVFTCIGVVMILVIIDIIAFRVVDHLSPGSLDMKSLSVFGISIILMVFIGSF